MRSGQQGVILNCSCVSNGFQPLPMRLPLHILLIMYLALPKMTVDTNIQTKIHTELPRLHLPSFSHYSFLLYTSGLFTDWADLFLVFSTLSYLEFINLSLSLFICQPSMELIPILGHQDGCRGIHGVGGAKGRWRCDGRWCIRG